MPFNKMSGTTETALSNLHQVFCRLSSVARPQVRHSILRSGRLTLTQLRIVSRPLDLCNQWHSCHTSFSAHRLHPCGSTWRSVVKCLSLSQITRKTAERG